MDTQSAAFACYERRRKSPQSLSSITQQQILLSRARRKKHQHLVKGDLHPVQSNTQLIHGTSLPTLVKKTKLIQFVERNQSSKLVKDTQLLKPISKRTLPDLGDMTPPLKLMRRGQPSKLIKMKAPEFRLSPPAIPLQNNNGKMGRSIYSPVN